MDNGAVLTRISPMGATGHGPREMAYTIRQNQVSYKTAFFVNVCAFASPQALAEVDRQLKIDERILRHLPIKKTFRDAIQPIPDIDHAPPPASGLDPSDPNYELQKFLSEYDREFPAGTQTSSQRPKHHRDSRDFADTKRDSGGSAVQNVIASLKASSHELKAKQKPGLEWLSDLKDSKDPPNS